MSLSKDVLLLTLQTLQITLKLQSVIPKLVYLITVQEAHKEYNSLTDQIRAKYEQLDQVSMGQLVPQYLMLKPVNWQIYLLI